MGYNSKDECIYEFHRDVPKTKEKKKRKSNHSHEYFRYGHRNKEQNEVIRRLLKKHIKYLYVIRYYNTYGKYFKHGKMIYQSRVYCFGIMTDTNEFQYYLVPYKTTTINYSSWINLYKSVLKDYIIDKDTEVLMDKDISTTDVVGTFFTIMHYTCLFRISRINAGDMYKRINHFYKFISKKKTFGEKSKTLVWDKLIEEDCMQYLPSDLDDKLSTYTFNKKWAIRDACVAMLYIFVKELLMAQKKKWQEKKKLEQEKQYNYSDVKDIEEINNKTNEEIKDIEDNETK